MKLSKHFTLQELTHSDIAIRNSLDNTPSKDIIPNLIRVAELLRMFAHYLISLSLLIVAIVVFRLIHY